MEKTSILKKCKKHGVTEYRIDSIGHMRCKKCQRVSSHNHYVKNKKRIIARTLETNKTRIERNKKFITSYLSTHPCVDCGETDLIVLDFDHSNPDKKSYDVCRLMDSSYSIKRIKKEIDKCSVRCANCHRRKTAKTIKSYRYLYQIGRIQTNTASLFNVGRRS